jgi:predicted ATPase
MKWDPDKLSELLTSLLAVGKLARSPNSDWRFELSRLRTLAGWSPRFVPGWVNHATADVTPIEAARPLRSLLWSLEPLFSSKSMPLSRLTLDVGQAVWDIHAALRDAGVPVNAWWLQEMHNIWPTRPEVSHIKKVEIKNFRCIRSMEATLKPLTVLIGQNDTGKSSFLVAMEMLINGGGTLQSNDYWRGDLESQVTIRADTTGGPIAFSSSPERTLGTKGELQPVCRFHFPSQGVVMTSEGAADEQGPPAIGADGSGVPALFDFLLRQDRTRFFAANEALAALIPGLQEINIGTPSRERRRIDLVLEDGFRLPAEQASAGVRLMLTFVALAYHPTPPRVILLEEPESGVHPKRLREVVRLLGAITAGKFGERAAQVIVTTHSPYLLDCIDLNTQQVIVFTREEDGSRTGRVVDEDRMKIFLDEFNLGEVWYNEGEEGMLKKS